MHKLPVLHLARIAAVLQHSALGALLGQASLLCLVPLEEDAVCAPVQLNSTSHLFKTVNWEKENCMECGINRFPLTDWFPRWLLVFCHWVADSSDFYELSQSGLWNLQSRVCCRKSSAAFPSLDRSPVKTGFVLLPPRSFEHLPGQLSGAVSEYK